MIEETLILEAVGERDIDLLLVEEIHCNQNFIQWFLKETKVKNNFQLEGAKITVEHSKITEDGREMDIWLSLTDEKKQTQIFLIENKINADEQKNQAEGYREESERLVKNGEAKEAHIILLCTRRHSEKYSTFANKFDSIITYEAIEKYFSDRSGLPNEEAEKRMNYRSKFMSQAIHKQRRGYQQRVHPKVEEFKQKYVELLKKEFPRLIPGETMLKKGASKQSKTMIFDRDMLQVIEGLPRMRLAHQLRERNAGLIIYDWGKHYKFLLPKIAEVLDTRYLDVVKTGNKRKNGSSSLIIISLTPFVDNLEEFEPQKEAILAGMEAANNLFEWVEVFAKEIRYWSQLIRIQEKELGK